MSERIELIDQGRGLYAMDHPLRVGPLPLGTRTTFIRLASGGVAIHSPGPLGSDGEARKHIESLGPVRAIIAPNLFHHFYIAENAQAFPEARLFAAPGLCDKIKGLPAAEVLGDVPPPLLADDLEQQLVLGAPRLGEVVFFHPASRTLLLTDLSFNMRHAPGAVSRLLLKLFGAWDRFGPSRLARSFIKDPEALGASIDRILAWDFDRISVTHGEIVPRGGKAIFEAAWKETLG